MRVKKSVKKPSRKRKGRDEELQVCDNNCKVMQINFKTAELKAEAVAAQQEMNVAEEVSAKAVYDKRVKRGADMLTDLQNATVGAEVPPVVATVVTEGVKAQSEFARQDMVEVVNRVVTDPAQASAVVGELTTKFANQATAFSNAVSSGAVLTNRF